MVMLLKYATTNGKLSFHKSHCPRTLIQSVPPYFFPFFCSFLPLSAWYADTVCVKGFLAEFLNLLIIDIYIYIFGLLLLLVSRKDWNLTPMRFLWHHIHSTAAFSVALLWNKSIGQAIVSLSGSLSRISPVTLKLPEPQILFHVSLQFAAAVLCSFAFTWNAVMQQLKASHCGDSMATCWNVLKSWCPVTDFTGRTEERPVAFERQVAAIQEG